LRRALATVLAVLPSCAAVLGLDEVAEVDRATVDAGQTPPGRDGAVRTDSGGPAVPAADAEAGSGAVDAADASDGAVPCSGASCERYVFVTSTPTTGALDGIVGANARCQTFAAASTLAHIRSRQFVAWISMLNNPVANRLVHGTAPYKRVDDAVIATSWTTFASASHLVAISLDESGNSVGDVGVWTASEADGTLAVNGDCNLWTVGTTADQGVIGLALTTDARWTKKTGAIGCEQRSHLYCVEK
jgi:hypothetical protein